MQKNALDFVGIPADEIFIKNKDKSNISVPL